VVNLSQLMTAGTQADTILSHVAAMRHQITISNVMSIQLFQDDPSGTTSWTLATISGSLENSITKGLSNGLLFG
jgi:hypothetical protein